MDQLPQILGVTRPIKPSFFLHTILNINKIKFGYYILEDYISYYK